MIETLKTLWYLRKVRIYESLICKMTRRRGKIKAKQAKYTKKCEQYRIKLNESTKIGKG